MRSKAWSENKKSFNEIIFDHPLAPSRNYFGTIYRARIDDLKILPTYFKERRYSINLLEFYTVATWLRAF